LISDSEDVAAKAEAFEALEFHRVGMTTKPIWLPSSAIPAMQASLKPLWKPLPAKPKSDDPDC
jgi:hypothetical protein